MNGIEMNGKIYDTAWSEDVLIPENIRYVSEVWAYRKTPKGVVRVTSEKKLNKLAEIIHQEYVGG